eukprot:2617019-Amphidinium_carterae.3
MSTLAGLPIPIAAIELEGCSSSCRGALEHDAAWAAYETRAHGEEADSEAVITHTKQPQETPPDLFGCKRTK